MSDKNVELDVYDSDYLLTPTVMSSVALDLLLAGSELLHKARLCFVTHRQSKINENIEMEPVAQGADYSSNLAMTK